jgi:hypothetical protein
MGRAIRDTIDSYQWSCSGRLRYAIIPRSQQGEGGDLSNGMEVVAVQVLVHEARRRRFRLRRTGTGFIQVSLSSG